MSEPTIEPTPVQTAFLVVVDNNGVISVHTDALPAVSVSRTATLYDVETYGSQLVRNVGRILTAGTLQAYDNLSADPTPADRVSEALTKRLEDQE